MKARTKIEKQVAASNEKLTALSPKVLTWAMRKVAGHVCFRTSAHKCTCGDCGRHFDYEGKGKSVCCPHCGTRLQIKDTNEKLTALSPKVLTWAMRKVAGHVCFRTSAHKCTCGDCGRHFDYEGKGKSVCCPHCGTRLQIKDTLKRTLKEAYYFSSLEVTLRP